MCFHLRNGIYRLLKLYLKITSKSKQHLHTLQRDKNTSGPCRKIAQSGENVNHLPHLMAVWLFSDTDSVNGCDEIGSLTSSNED